MKQNFEKMSNKDLLEKFIAEIDNKDYDGYQEDEKLLEELKKELNIRLKDWLGNEEFEIYDFFEYERRKWRLS